MMRCSIDVHTFLKIRSVSFTIHNTRRKHHFQSWFLRFDISIKGHAAVYELFLENILGQQCTSRPAVHISASRTNLCYQYTSRQAVHISASSTNLCHQYTSRPAVHISASSTHLGQQYTSRHNLPKL